MIDEMASTFLNLMTDIFTNNFFYKVINKMIDSPEIFSMINFNMPKPGLITKRLIAIPYTNM